MTGKILMVLLVMSVFGTGVDAQEMPRLEKEIFLKKARIVSIKDVGEGATKPLKVVLEHNGKQMKAIFKSVDIRQEANSRFSGETVNEYIDSYKHELAAYELDKMLGLNILPVIVERHIEGKKGSLREWVDDVMPRYGHEQMPADMKQERDRIQLVWLFDYLIYNVDRRTHNLMLGNNWQPVLIDHSMAFTLFQKPFRPLYRFPKEMIDRLQALDDGKLTETMRPFLRHVQIDALIARKKRVLDLVAQRIAASDTQSVFFALKDIQ